MTLTDSILTTKQLEAKRRRSYVDGLRQMADFLEAHPDLPSPHGCSHNVFVNDKSELAAIARAAGVKWQKHAIGDYFALSVEFSGETSYEVNIERDRVCRKVVTGTHIEPAKPAQPEQVVETYEWVCDEPLLAGAK